MRGVRIEDGTNRDPTASLPPGSVSSLNFDLADVLQALGDRALRSEWHAEALDCFGDSYSEIMSLSESDTPIPGDQLLRVAEREK